MMNKGLILPNFHFKKATLRTAPWHKWNEPSTWNGLFVTPDRKLYDSGYHFINIWGYKWCDTGIEVWQVGYGDDFRIHNNLDTTYSSVSIIGMDCLRPSGVLRYHTDPNYTFDLDISVSSVWFKLRKLP